MEAISKIFLPFFEMLRITCRRYFHSTNITRGLFTSYIEQLRPQVKEIDTTELASLITKDPIHGPAKNIHILDVR